MKRLMLALALLSLGGCVAPTKVPTTQDAQAPGQVHPKITSHRARVATNIGASIDKKPITSVRFDCPCATQTILIFAGIHGDEPTTSIVAQKLIELLESDDSAVRDSKCDLVIVPRASPDGLEKRTRTNAKGVDLN